MRGTSLGALYQHLVSAISIHVPLAGNVFVYSLTGCAPSYFYPRSPCGERRRPDGQHNRHWRISIHVPLAGNVVAVPRKGSIYSLQFLSTFPLRGTSGVVMCPCRHKHISIHVPLAGNVLCIMYLLKCRPLFLSTFPLRGTSFCARLGCSRRTHFYPRSPCGERQSLATLSPPGLPYFYPRSPCGERRRGCFIPARDIGISIHVPLAGNVLSPFPRGERAAAFLSTFPLRGTSLLMVAL